MCRMRAAFAALTLSFAVAPATADVRPVSIDTTMEELLGEERGDLLLASEHLDLAKLDYSLESLKEIDAWLEAVHEVNAAEAETGKAGASLKLDGRGRNTVTLAGLYLGETVKRNSDLGWAWVPFDAFIAENPAYAEHYGAEAGLDTYILVGQQGAATPINAALKRIIHGRADSIAYVGKFLATPIDFEKAVEGFDPGPEPRIVDWQLDDLPTAGTAGSTESEMMQIFEAANIAELRKN